MEGNASKAYWINREAFELIDDVLYVMEEADKKLVIPASLKKQAMTLNRDIPLAAHQGIDRTKARVKEKFYWHTLSADVKEFVRSCEICNKNKKNGSVWQMSTYRVSGWCSDGTDSH